MIAREQLANILGTSISKKEFSTLIKSAELKNPGSGLFLETVSDSNGLYVVMAGKVRLVNKNKDLIATINPDGVFGECTLFPQDSFLDYAVRTSKKVELCYIQARALQPLMQKNATLRKHLHDLAQAKDLEQKTKFPQAQESPTNNNNVESSDVTLFNTF